MRRTKWGESDLVVCESCRTEFVIPQPTDERLAEIYGDGYYNAWAYESADAVSRMKQMTFEPLLEACKLRPGQKLLDVGCATGDLISLATDRGCEGYGIDLNRLAVEQARTRVAGATFACATLADNPFPGTLFDAVTMVDFIEHVRDPEAELLAAAKLLVPSGKLVISTPRTDSVTKRLTGTAWPQYREEHLTYFSLLGIHAALQRAGYFVRSVRSTTKLLTPAYLYGQSEAYPLPVLSAALRAVWQRLPIPKHRPVPLKMGEMTVVAERRR